ncbi:uncharacterized protein LOC132943036 [Metopolophium dirhodum]|uniref:uncharacterized protein LOC132943036 n=1 Tax=Metopolophium dirhodum TaxID=44670 RepID=UPI00298FE679|nr:uncharacterized protein LOC132943036 [Metopolophium dirhodum]
MQFQVSFALLAMVVCFAAAETKTPTSAQSADASRSKRTVVVPLAASPYVAAPYAAVSPYLAAPYAAASPYVAASPYLSARYAATPYAAAAAPYAAVASPYVSAYSTYSTYPYVAKTLASPYTATYYP